MDYKIIVASPMEALIEKTNSQIKDGWRPIGGLTVDQGYFYQALIKEEVLIPKDSIPIDSEKKENVINNVMKVNKLKIK